MRNGALALAAALVAASSTAFAQTDTLFGAPGASTMQHGSIYIGAGPQYQSLGMPKYNLGFTRTDTAFNDLGAQAEHTLRAEMLGGNAVIGHVFGTMPAWLGAHPRVELGGMIAASAGESDFRTNRAFGGTQLLNGFIPAYGCNPCDWTSSLRRNAKQFRLWLMMGADHALAPEWYLTPSFGAIGGRVRVSDELRQTFAAPGGTPPLSQHYTATTHLHWRDIGGRGKLVLTYKPRPWLALFVGGHIDLTSRRATFDGVDSYLDGFSRSTASDSATRFNFAGGGQFGVTFADGNWLLVSLIGAVDYDHRVPRIERPFGGNLAVNDSTFQTPARIAFGSAVNYAAHLRIVVRLP